MRLTVLQKQSVCDCAEKYFGRGTKVWLFGSRVNDEGKGGDIDLYIEPELHSAEELINAKLYFLRELQQQIGEQKIDIVLRRTNNTLDLPVYHIAKQTGILLT